MTKLTMMVCPHDTVKEPDRWYRLEQYLVQKLGTEMQFELSLDFEDFHANLNNAHVAFLNPMDCLKMRKQGYLPLVRIDGNYDEAVLVASTEVASPTVAMLQGETLASVESQIPTKIALMMLKNNGVAPAGILNKDSWLSVMSGIWNGEATFGIVYKDTYDNLSDQGKSMVQFVAESNEQHAFHCFSIAPSLADRADEITALLTEMHNDPQGQEVLQELGIPRWVQITQAELDQMEQLMTMSI